MRIEFYARVSKKGKTEYIAIPKNVKPGMTLYGKTVHVVIELVDKINDENNN